MGALEELLAKWRVNPDAGATLALCTYLGSAQKEDLVREVGTTAEAWHKDDGQVMLAVGRMYLDALLLPEAQAALVAAGKASPSDASPYRYLGEVLLRRGDAVRAEKVFARSIQLGPADGDTRMWHDRAVVYVALQKRVGMKAVADEIARTIPKKTSIPPPTYQANARRSSSVMPSVPPAPRLVAQGAARHTPATGRAPAPPMVQAARPAADLAPPMIAAAPPLSSGKLPRFDSSPDSSGFLEDVVTNPRISRGEILDGSSTAVMAVTELPYAAHPSERPAPRRLSSVPPPSVPPPPGPRPLSSVPPPPVPLKPRVPSPPSAGPASMFGRDDSPHPAPETVLDHLSRVGVFERGGGAAPAWEAAAREKSRGVWVLVAAMVLAVGAGSGGFFYARQVKNERMARARDLQTEVDRLLRTGRTADLKATDDRLSEIFDLDSRSHKAALLWLENRVLSALLLPGEPRGIESALHRCETVGCEPARMAFGRVASFLSEGDLAGAAALLPKWDEKAKSDAFYQFTAGAMLERAGDVRAIGRYKKAFDLDDSLTIARLLHAPLVALELGLEEAKPFLDAAQKRVGDRPSGKALRGLEWALSADRSEAPPPGTAFDAEETDELPVPLRSIPLVVEALAKDPGSDEGRAKLDAALRVAATPAVATWIGFVAINRGDEELARKATLRALAHSAIYPRARALAARVALLGARLEEAGKAIQELDPTTAEVAVVRAATAYETLDTGELESAVSAMGDPAEDSPASRALSRGLDLVMGKSYPDTAALEAMAVPGVPWGDIVAVDAALDQGDLEFAKTIANDWKNQEEIPVYALRAARLARYAGDPAAALAAIEQAIVPGGMTPRVLIEAVYVFVAAEKPGLARELVAKYPAVLGPLTDWLKVVIDVAEGNAGRAKALAARLEPLPADSPLLFHVMMARALAEVGDTRARPVIATALARSRKHPDLLQAGRTAGVLR